MCPDLPSLAWEVPVLVTVIMAKATYRRKLLTGGLLTASEDELLIIVAGTSIALIDIVFAIKVLCPLAAIDYAARVSLRLVKMAQMSWMSKPQKLTAKPTHDNVTQKHLP